MSAESFKAYLGRVQTAVKQKSDGIQIAALKSLEAEHKTRIFNDGQATTGQPIGKYSPGYAKKKKISRTANAVRRFGVFREPQKEYSSRKVSGS